MKKFSVIVCVIALPMMVFAWGQTGHRVIGELAQMQLTKKTAKKVTAVLSNSTVAMESNWGDFIKSDTTYREYSKWHYTNIEAGVTRHEFDSLAMLQTRGELVYRIGYLIDELKLNPDRKSVV